MDDNAKKTALRMIPYGLYVLSAQTKDGRVAASTVNWVTQTAFAPPTIVIGVKADSITHGVIKESGCFALNILSKSHKDTAFSFFKPPQPENGTLHGESYRTGTTGSPILESVPAFVECKLTETFENGDHSVFIGEVVDAGLSQTFEGRADEMTLTLKDLGDNVFYGG